MNFFHEGSFSKRGKPKLKLQREILKQSFLKEKSLLVRLIKRGKLNAKSLSLPQPEQETKLLSPLLRLNLKQG
jgi:hypothetical protein